MSKIIIFLNIKVIKLYQYILSPIIGNNCRYMPTCSEYYIQCLKTHGLLKGTYLGVIRILRCHPFKNFGGGEGIDFVPNKKIIKKGKN
tara:strand:+ start:108 stop:371 length:264 start_codon:yes stop_codon:yes gene_type:complete